MEENAEGGEDCRKKDFNFLHSIAVSSFKPFEQAMRESKNPIVMSIARHIDEHQESREIAASMKGCLKENGTIAKACDARVVNAIATGERQKEENLYGLPPISVARLHSPRVCLVRNSPVR